MGWIGLRDYQREAVDKMKTGCILCGGVGSGKSRTAIAYYYSKNDGDLEAETYVQVSLLGLAGYVKIGNSLSNPITGSDSRENYWYTPLYFADTWVMRRTIQNFNELCRR